MAAVAVWRRPIVALYVFIVGLALHNLVLSLLYDAGLRGVGDRRRAGLEGGAARRGRGARRDGRDPRAHGSPSGRAWSTGSRSRSRPSSASTRSSRRTCSTGKPGAQAILYGLRHGLVPVVAYFLGRSLIVDRATSCAGSAGRCSAPVQRSPSAGSSTSTPWTSSGGAAPARSATSATSSASTTTVPGGLPDNWAFNTEDGLFRRLVSSFISPLATAFALVVALLFAGIAWQDRRRRPLAAVLVAVCAAGLLFTLSRSSLLALAGAFVVLAVALRRWWPIVATAVVLAAGVGFAFAFTSVAPETHFFPEDLPYQEEQARKHGDLPGGGSLALNPGEPSLRSHWRSLRDGIETVFEHPQGYGLGNAGAIAVRFGVPLRAGESNYTETGVEAGLAGALLLIAWSLALLVRARALGVGCHGRNVPGGGSGRCSRSRRCSRARRADRCVRRALACLQPLVALRVACRPVRPRLTATLRARST